MPLRHFRCASCGYGAMRHAAPFRCPMCGGNHWQQADTHGARLAQLEGILPGVPFS
jgi:Zn finger protein HypA/HybF involved in hydrogenase expression